MYDRREEERERENDYYIYILSIDFLRCNENNHLTHIARAKLNINVHRLLRTVFDFIYYFDYFYCMSFSSQQRMLQHHNNCFNIPIACERYPPPNML